MHPGAMGPVVGPRMPMYPSGAPRFEQQLFYGQGPPAIILPQQQLVPGMMPIFFMPMPQPGQQNQRQGGRQSGTGPMQQTQQPLPFMQPQMQMLPKGRGYRYPPGRDMPDVPGLMLPVPYGIGGMPLHDAAFAHPMATGALASALANATTAQLRTLLGENIYPLVDQLEHKNAAKVTGMLLEMDQTEVLHLLESPEALKGKLAEAMEILRNRNRSKSTVQPIG